MNAQMKSLSPQHLKLLVVGAGVMGLFAIWDVVQGKVESLRFQPIYGEQVAVVAEPLREELYSLPIVVARNEATTLQGAEISDADIEAAFREPVIEAKEDEVEPITVTLSQQFMALYRPVVSGVSSNGAIVNGQFWAVGEAMVSMKLRKPTGELVTPKIHSIRARNVGVVLGDELISLAFTSN